MIIINLLFSVSGLIALVDSLQKKKDNESRHSPSKGDWLRLTRSLRAPVDSITDSPIILSLTDKWFSHCIATVGYFMSYPRSTI